MGEVDETRDFLSEAAARLPDAMALHRGAAELYKTHALPELAAFELVHEARALRAANDADGALDCATRALELRSNDLGALRLRVDLLLDSDQPGSAMEDALRLIDLLGERDMIAPALDLAERMVVVEPRNIPIRSRLVRLLSLRNDVAAQVVQLRELARLHAEADQMEPAAECLRQLLEFRPDDTRARIAYIEAYRHIGSEADLADDYLALAKAHARTGAIMEANRVFDRAISVAPERHDIHEMYIQFLLKNGDRANAIAKACDLSTLMVDDQQARRAVELLQSLGVKEGVDPRYHECLGRAQLSVNSRGQAMREWRLAASIHLQRGAHDQVARILAEMLAVDPFNLEIRQQLIDAHLNAGQISDALNAQEELALRYMERGLCDLAEVELRKVIALEPQRPDAWRALFKACLTLVDERQLIPDYLEFADLMVSRGEIREAVDYYFKVIELDPRNLRAHRGYVIQYPKIGRHQDIVDTILTYAQLLVENGNVDEGSRYFELVMSIDPGNTMARDMLSATASRAEQELPTAGAAKTGPGKEPRTGRSGLHPIPGFAGVPPNLESSFDDERLTDTQKRFIREKTVSASDYLAGALDQFEKEESAEALAQVVTNYRTILAANAQNAPVRLKLADVLEQMGRMPEMLNELFLASETLFQRGELAQCVQVCERFLSHNPTDQRMRKRLSEAVVKRDAMKALESAISFSDDSEDR
jgi:tetratricopeptide (TPR) repeat protein